MRLVAYILFFSVVWSSVSSQDKPEGQLYAGPSENTIEIDLNASLNLSLAKVDDFVMQTHSDQFATFDNLANFLVRDYSQDVDKVRSIYTWIALNISYSPNTVNENSYSQSAENVWKSKRAVCEGYAKLFHEMCNAADIESRIIKGYVKEFAGENLKYPNHAWNSVKIHGKWKLLDVTWASVNNESSLLANSRLQKSYTRHKLDHFFLVNPNRMLLTHLPEDPYWQLQSNLINLETFLESEEDIRLALSNPYKEMKNFEILIADYEQLDSLDKKISYLERMERNKWNRTRGYGLGVAYYYKAQKILKEANSNNRLEANHEAKSYFKKSLNQLSNLNKEDYGYEFSQDLANSVAFRIETLQ